MSIEDFEIVATGVWLYDGTVPYKINLLAKPASQSDTRWEYDPDIGDYCIDESSPIPLTPDGKVYSVENTEGGEFQSMSEALEWADNQPWGPVKWTFLSK